jgi:hypothetical protein
LTRTGKYYKQYIMFKLYHDCTFENASSFNWVGFFALIISLFSIACSFLFVYLGKRVEILTSKFQKFCISNLDFIFSILEEKFNNGNINLSSIRNEISTCTSDIQLFCVILKDIYPRIELREIETFTEIFSDKMYEEVRNNKRAKAYDYKLDYMKFKVGVYSKLYDFILKQELNPFTQIKMYFSNRNKS